MVRSIHIALVTVGALTMLMAACNKKEAESPRSESPTTQTSDSAGPIVARDAKPSSIPFTCRIDKYGGQLKWSYAGPSKTKSLLTAYLTDEKNKVEGSPLCDGLDASPSTRDLRIPLEASALPGHTLHWHATVIDISGKHDQTAAITISQRNTFGDENPTIYTDSVSFTVSPRSQRTTISGVVHFQ